MDDPGKDPQNGDPGNDPLWVASDEEVQKQVQTLYNRIRKLCQYQHKEQRLSAQIITSVLIEIAGEVSGEWWGLEFEEFLADMEEQYPEDPDGDDGEAEED